MRYLSANLPVNLSGQGAPVRLESTLVEVELFKTLGVQPAAGRAFTSEDGGPDGARVVVLSHALALTLFGNPPAAVGRTLSLDHQGYTVIGVMPPSFVFPRAETALWRPLRLTAPALMANRSNHILFAIGRLRAGVSLESARSEMELIAGQLQRAYPKDNAKSGIGVIDLRDLMSPQARTMVVGVFGAALCLMLIACTNLANLLFARAVVRKPEMAIRVAAGAARGRLVRQLLTESLVLAGMGGVSGSLLAMASTPLFARLAPNGLPIDGAPEVDLRVLGFAAFVTLLTSVLFGVGPALRSCRRPDLQALRSRSASGGNTDRLRAGLGTCRSCRVRHPAGGHRAAPEGAVARAGRGSRIPRRGRADVTDGAADAQVHLGRRSSRFLLPDTHQRACASGSHVGGVRQLSPNGAIQRPVSGSGTGRCGRSVDGAGRRSSIS